MILVSKTDNLVEKNTSFITSHREVSELHRLELFYIYALKNYQERELFGIESLSDLIYVTVRMMKAHGIPANQTKSAAYAALPRLRIYFSFDDDIDNREICRLVNFIYRTTESDFGTLPLQITLLRYISIKVEVMRRYVIIVNVNTGRIELFESRGWQENKNLTRLNISDCVLQVKTNLSYLGVFASSQEIKDVMFACAFDRPLSSKLYKTPLTLNHKRKK